MLSQKEYEVRKRWGIVCSLEGCVKLLHRLGFSYNLQERLKGTKIKQVFLPAYSLNLNLIERVWKLMRKKVIDSCLYRKFEHFKEKVFEFFEHITKYQQELETLISWDFYIPKFKTTFH